MSDDKKITTLHGTPIDELREQQAKQPVGMHSDYIVLTEAERANGFVRPVRRSYKHVNVPRIGNPLRDLTPEEHERYDRFGYVKFETYVEPPGACDGRYWTQAQLDAIGKGCGTVTTMGQALAETYARDPSFYGATYCCGCNKHLPVGAGGEFDWHPDGGKVGT